MPWKVINALFCTGKNENRYNIDELCVCEEDEKS